MEENILEMNEILEEGGNKFIGILQDEYSDLKTERSLKNSPNSYLLKGFNNKLKIIEAIIAIDCEKTILATPNTSDNILIRMKELEELNHENVVRIHRIFLKENISGSYLFICSEYYENTLQNIIESKNGIPQTEAVEYIQQMVKGIEYLNSENIEDIDLEPWNIYIEDRVIKIGWCVSINELLNIYNIYTKQSNIISKSKDILQLTQYSPPEYWDTEFSTKISDKEEKRYTWEIGCIFYALIQGKPPFGDIGSYLHTQSEHIDKYTQEVILDCHLMENILAINYLTPDFALSEYAQEFIRITICGLGGRATLDYLGEFLVKGVGSMEESKEEAVTVYIYIYIYMYIYIYIG